MIYPFGTKHFKNQNQIIAISIFSGLTVGIYLAVGIYLTVSIYLLRVFCFFWRLGPLRWINLHFFFFISTTESWKDVESTPYDALNPGCSWKDVDV